MKKKMKAALLHEIGEQLSIESVEVPTSKTEEVVVKIKATGLCHSDINYLNGISPVSRLPIILGHEISGIIMDIGENVEGLEKEDRVCIHYVKSCGKCIFCAIGRENLCERYQMIGKDTDGGFAEYIVVPAKNVLKLPECIPFEQGAIIGCAVSTAFHSLNRGKIDVGDVVVIFGVGGVGIHAVQLAARIFGAGRVIAVDISDPKLELARKLGADYVINGNRENVVEKIGELTKGKYADVALEFIGSGKTIEDAINCVGKAGRMVIVGIGAEEIRISPYKTIIGKEMELIGANDHLKSEIDQLIKLVQNGKIDLSDSVTHLVTLDDINRGFEILERRIGDPIRVVVFQ